jgi:outer membrane protein TolC
MCDQRRNEFGIGLGILFFIGIMICPSYSLSIGSDQEMAKFSLESAINYALEHNPLLLRTRIDQDRAELFVEDVKAQSVLPVFSLSGQSGIVPEARGDIFESPDKQSDLDGWGPFYKMDIKLVQPLVTFGRRASAIEAAVSVNSLQESQNRAEIEKLKLVVIQAYWALASARKAEDVAEGLRQDYEKLTAEVEKRLLQEESEVDDSDLLEVRSNRFLIDEIYIKSRTQRQQAEKALNTLIGRDIELKVEVEDKEIPQIDIHGDEIEKKIDFFLQSHPNMQSLKASLSALQSRVDLESATKKPMIYIAGGLGFAHAPHRSDQTNPFAVDDFNYFGLGAYLGLEWDLNSFRKNFKAAQFSLEKQSMEQNLKLLQAQLHLQIMKAFTQVIENWELLLGARESLESSKSWVKLSLDNWDMGLGEVDRILRSYNSYYRLQALEIERELKLNTSLADLAYCVGDINLYLDWIRNEKVYLD